MIESIDAPEEIERAIKGWKYQAEMDTCLPTCLYNVLSEIAGRKNNYPSFMPTIEQLRQLTGHTPGGASWEEAHKGIRVEMRRKKVIEWTIETKEDVRMDTKRLCNLVQDMNTSFPIITMGGEYIADAHSVKLSGSPHTWLSHSVVVVMCEADSFFIFDTYNFDGKSPIKKIDRNTFEEYWICGSPRKGVMWFEKKNLALEGFNEGDAK